MNYIGWIQNSRWTLFDYSVLEHVGGIPVFSGVFCNEIKSHTSRQDKIPCLKRIPVKRDTDLSGLMIYVNDQNVPN